MDRGKEGALAAMGASCCTGPPSSGSAASKVTHGHQGCVSPSSRLPRGCHCYLHSTDEKNKSHRFTATHSANLSQPVFTLGCSERPIIFVSTE